MHQSIIRASAIASRRLQSQAMQNQSWQPFLFAISVRLLYFHLSFSQNTKPPLHPNVSFVFMGPKFPPWSQRPPSTTHPLSCCQDAFNCRQRSLNRMRNSAALRPYAASVISMGASSSCSRGPEPSLPGCKTPAHPHTLIRCLNGVSSSRHS